MNDVDTRATVTDLYQAYGRRDTARVASLIHEDIDWIIYGPVTVFPFAGPRRGRAAVLEVLAGIGRDYEVKSHTVEFLLADGDRAAVMADIGYLQRATHRSMRFRVANFLRLQDGKVIEFREFANTFDVVEQALGRELLF